MDSRGQAVRSVTRALALLRAVARGPKTLTMLANDAEVSLSTASRLLSTLRTSGFVAQDGDGTYIPGPELTSIALSLDAWAGIRLMAHRAAQTLCERVNETAAFFVRAGDERLCIASVESNRMVRRICSPGERAPIYLGATGKALVAFSNTEGKSLGLSRGVQSFVTTSGQRRTLDDFSAECAEIRRRGYAFSSRESTTESWAVAAPVYDRSTLLGVLTVVVPLTRSSEDYIETLARVTVEVAKGCSTTPSDIRERAI